MQRLENLGLSADVRAIETPYNTTVVSCRDPDGVLIELINVGLEADVAN